MIMMMIYVNLGCNGPNDIECNGNTCLRNARCNAVKQCDDGEDEEGCTESKC